MRAAKHTHISSRGNLSITSSDKKNYEKKKRKINTTSTRSLKLKVWRVYLDSQLPVLMQTNNAADKCIISLLRGGMIELSLPERAQ